MYRRLRRLVFEERYGSGNREALKTLVDSGLVAGILAYQDNEAVACCSVAPMEDFPNLDRSPLLKRLDDAPAWSLTCFFIAGERRGAYMFSPLVEAALDYAKRRGASVVDAYPSLNIKRGSSDSDRCMGVHSAFLRLGFNEVARRRDERAIMRSYLTDYR